MNVAPKIKLFFSSYSHFYKPTMFIILLKSLTNDKYLYFLAHIHKHFYLYVYPDKHEIFPYKAEHVLIHTANATIKGFFSKQ